MDRYVFNPFSFVLLVLFFLLLLVIIPLLLLGLIGGALINLGFSCTQAILILILALLGSFINIPVSRIETHQVVVRPEYTFFGVFYRIREVSPTTIIAINVGGAVIPATISLYLFGTILIPLGGFVLASALGGIVLVAVITNRVAQPVRGLGIATPIFIPPLAALIAGIVFSWNMPAIAPVIAFISGTLGTLIGADLLNLHKIGDLGAPVASIGGAGTFDGIFLSGVIAALLA